MNPFVLPEKIYISQRPQDMRAGIQRLACIITLEFEREPMDGALYVFISRDARKAKMLSYDTNGWCLYYVTFSKETFRWVHSSASTKPLLALEKRELLWLLEGLSIKQNKAAKRIEKGVII